MSGQLAVPLAVCVANGLLDREQARRVLGALETTLLPGSFDAIVDEIVAIVAEAKS